MFTDPEVVQAQVELTRRLHESLADLPSYIALTLGNEVNQFSGDPHPAPMRATPQQAGDWLDSLLGAIPEHDQRLALHAEYDAIWRSEERRVGKECRARWTSAQSKKTRERRSVM